MELLLYPLIFLAFWYRDGIKTIVILFSELNRYCLQLLSVPLFLKTFFKPLKNEYRGDLVIFSIIMGVAVKTILLSAAACMLGVLLALEIICVIVYALLPILPIYLLL